MTPVESDRSSSTRHESESSSCHTLAIETDEQLSRLSTRSSRQVVAIAARTVLSMHGPESESVSR